MDAVYSTWVDAAGRRRIASGVVITRHTRGIGDEIVSKYSLADVQLGIGQVAEPQWIYLKFDAGYRISSHRHPDEWRFLLDGEPAHPSDDQSIRWAHLGEFVRRSRHAAARTLDRFAAEDHRVPAPQSVEKKSARKPSSRSKKNRDTDYDRVIAALFAAVDAGVPVVAGGVAFSSGYFKCFYGVLIDVFNSLGSTRKSLDENISRGGITIVAANTFGVMGLDVAKARLPVSLSPSERHTDNIIEFAVQKDVSLR